MRKWFRMVQVAFLLIGAIDRFMRLPNRRALVNGTGDWLQYLFKKR